MEALAIEERVPRVQQLSVFIENRTLDLARVESALAEANVRLVAISLLSAADHAVARLVVDRVAGARSALEGAGFPVYTADLIGVVLSHPEEGNVGIRPVLAALLAAEVRVETIFALTEAVQSRAALALHVDDPQLAARALRNMGLTLLDQSDLST